MKKFHKPDIKGMWSKVRNLKKEDVKEYLHQRKVRREMILEKRRNSAFAKKMQPVYRFMNRISILMHALLACVINFFIEVISRHSFIEAWDYMTGSPWVFLYNAFLIFITFSIVYLVRRRVFARIILTVFWMALGVTNGYMLIKRVTPFNAQDLKVMAEAMAIMNNYFDPLELVMLIVGIGAVIVWVIAMWRRGGQFTGKLHRWMALIGIGCCALGYSVVTKYAIDNRVISTYFGNIAFAYEDYGFPYCFSASLFNTGIHQPNGYSEAKMDEISKKGEITMASTDTKERPNIIVVQLESYFDPLEVEFFETSEDPIPNLREMSKNYSSGYFKVPSVGAGTANTEFEVLTGMNMRYFGPGEYPYKTYVKDKQCESAASALEMLGYGTHALHNNGGNFYSRAKVYNNMGFDSFTSKEFMNILQFTENGWAKDDILVDQITEAMDSDEERDFVFCVSVQGHGDYPEEPVLEDPHIKLSGIEDEATKNKWEYYVNQVYEMDAFAGHLIEEVKKCDEPTVVVFYGDHLPTLGLEVKDLKSRYLYNTNYVIWDNMGLKKSDRNIPAYQIMADVFDRVGFHTGSVFNYHQQRRQTKNYLSDLELLQYDMLYGEGYIYQGETPKIGGYMEMGVKDVYITDLVSHLDGAYSIYGEHFTKYSKVYINGEKQKSTFLNNTRIDLKESTLKEGDVVEISQVGSSNTIFRTSAAYVYYDGKLVEQTEETAETVEEEISDKEAVGGEDSRDQSADQKQEKTE